MRFFIVLLLFAVCSTSAGAEKYSFATYPSNTPDALFHAFTPITEYLSRKTGHTFTLTITRDYRELSERLANDTVDFAWIGSTNYIKAKRILPDLRYLATYQERSADGSTITPFYRSYILASTSSGVTELTQTRGRRFAFVDIDSTSGYAYPNMILKKKGIKPEAFFSHVFFLKKHDRVIEALVSGSIDSGAVSDGTYENARKKYGDQFVILEKSEPIPLDAIVASPKVPAELIQKVTHLLTELPADHPIFAEIQKHLGWPAAGFSNKGDAFYDSLRSAQER